MIKLDGLKCSQVPALKKQLAEILKQPEEFLKEADAKQRDGAAPAKEQKTKAKDAGGPDKAELVRALCFFHFLLKC